MAMTKPMIMMHLVFQSLICFWMLLLLFSSFYDNGLLEESRAKSVEVESPRPTLQRQFRSYHSDVYVIENFLPNDLALDWQRRMYESWKDTELLLDCMEKKGTATADDDIDSSSKKKKNDDTTNDSQICCSNMLDEDGMMLTTTIKHNSYHYATNNDGLSDYRKSLFFSNNAKTRSLSNIQQRNITAHQMKQDHKFSYAKWELSPTHDLVQEMEDYMVKQSTRDLVKQILSKDHPNLNFQSQLADLFVTYFGKGDFLYTHNDAVSGTWAFVLSLAQLPNDHDDDDNDVDTSSSSSSSSWNKEMGGALQFQCPHQDNVEEDEKNTRERTKVINKISPDYFCEELVPTFNTAVIFNTRVVGSLDDGRMRMIRGPDHQVLTVMVPPESGYFRFGMTGWYMDVDDIMDDKTKAELTKIRGRDD